MIWPFFRPQCKIPHHNIIEKAHYCTRNTSGVSARFVDELCSTRPKPLTALLIAGGFRSFTDPRAYMSVRQNFIDSFGGNIVVFIFGRLTSEYRPQHNIRKNTSKYNTRMEHVAAVHAAAAALAENGGPPVILSIANGTSPNIVNAKCGWYPDNMHMVEMSYVGQLHSWYIVNQMMVQYEQEHGVKFVRVAKARPDLVWLTGVKPWCAYSETAAYTSAVQDWFFLLPRSASHRVLSVPFETYLKCNSREDMEKIAAKCCGGGPTGLLLGALCEQRLPIVGADWASSKCQKFGSPPAGMLPNSPFSCLVMRDESEDEWCNSMYLEFKTSNANDWPPALHYFASEAQCTEALEPRKRRHNLVLRTR